MKNFVSIIIPVYNVEKYIQECIISCVNQTYNNIEIIAIDDGSTDSSPSILDELAIKYNQLKVIHKKNGGVSSARNIGIKESKGDYIVFVDGDDYLSYEAIEYMMEIVKQTSSDFAILKNCFTSINQKQYEDKIEKISNEDAIILLLGLSMELGCWNKIYSKRLIQKNKIFFDEKLFYGEGLQFILKIAQNAKKIGIGTKSVYYYRKNNMQSATSSFNYEKFENGEKALFKIKEEFIDNSKKIEIIWMYHYAMFCQNALVACINNKKNIDDYVRVYKKWKEKFNTFFLNLFFSEYIFFKEKIKLLIILISPHLFAMLRNKKMKENVKRSV